MEVEEYVDPPSPDCCGGADPDHAPPPSPKGWVPCPVAYKRLLGLNFCLSHGAARACFVFCLMVAKCQVRSRW